MKEHIVFIEASLTGAGEKTCQYAHETGRQVTLICKAPAMYHEDITDFVDDIIVADTNDADAIIKILDTLYGRHKINGVTTTSDFYVVQTAKVAEHFGLITTPYAKVEILKNKYLMRKALEAIDPDLNPNFALALNYEEGEQFALRNGFPFIAKPQDANDSLYVKVIHDSSSLKDYFDDRKKWGNNVVGQVFADGVLLEELIGGQEYCLDVLQPSRDVSMVCVGAFMKKLAGQDTGNFIKIGASYPAPEEDTQKLFYPISVALKSLGVVTGALNIDCKLVNGHPKILEINPRLVGDQMGSHMIELATGQNPAHAVVEMALGNSFVWLSSVKRAVAIHRITMAQAGYFYGIGDTDSISRDPNVAYVNELGNAGQWYDPARSNQDVVGSIIAVGDNTEDAMNTAEKWAQTVGLVSCRTKFSVPPIRKNLFRPTPGGIAILKS